MKRLQRSTVSHQIFIYSFKILIWENPITISPSRKHQTEAERFCKLVDADAHNTSLTSFCVLFHHFFEASCGETFKCFLLLRGKNWFVLIFGRVSLQKFLSGRDSDGDWDLPFHPVHVLRAHLERPPRRKALLSILNNFPLTIWPLLCLLLQEGHGPF